MINKLRAAIRGKYVCSLRYDDTGNRRVEPHIVYESRNGKIMVDVYQTSGYSSTGKLPSWRPLIVDSITSITISSDQFTPRINEGYNPSNAKRYSKVICKV